MDFLRYWLRVITACILLLPGVLWAREDLIVVGNHAPPYRIVQDREFSGIYVDTLKEIAKRIGVRLHFVETPFPRALLMMQGNQADIMLGPNRTPAREAFMIYTEAAFPREDKAFYIPTNAADIKSYDDLASLRISVQIGRVYFPRFDQDTGLRKEPVSDYLLGISKVDKGRNDVIIMPEQQGDWLLKQTGIKLKKASYKAEGDLSFITIAKQSGAIKYRKAIEETLQQLKEEGVIQQILERYR